MKSIIAISIFLQAILIGVTARGEKFERQNIDLNKGWTVYPAFDVSNNASRKNIDLPHTWNTEDITKGLNYFRGAMVYQRQLTVGSEYDGCRLFLYFEGANSVSDVFVNGKFVGEHLGGYTAFCFEITDFVGLDKEATLTVIVSNAYRTDVLPLSGDFNVFGGIHRPVHLIITHQNCISPLDFASSGVYIIPDTVSESEADFTIKTKLSLHGQRQNLRLTMDVFDANIKLKTRKEVKVPSEGSTEVNEQFHISKPNLWNGQQNPYCYSIQVRLWEGENLVDQVNESTGFRYFAVTPSEGFLLNGHYLDLVGFGMHEDIEGKGSAYSPEDYDNDMAVVRESGATALRLTHYPHGKKIYDLCDQQGLVLWTEIPFVGPGGYTGTGYVASDAFQTNTENTLVEMIRQNYNHPSIFFWGLLNELKFDYDNPVPFVKELNNIAKREDPSRLTTSASFDGQTEFVNVTDVGGWNVYLGWYGGMPAQVGSYMDEMKSKVGNKPVCITEFGAGASINQHQSPSEKPIPGGKFHPEEWQLVYHEGNWKALSSRKYIWAKFVWNFADFSSSIRNEGENQGINDKGLLTYDHQIKKDAFFFYKANWNPQPMVHIASKRFVNRTDSLVNVEAFCNTQAAVLWVNGKKIGQAAPDSIHTIHWKSILLKPGENKIEVRAKSKAVVLSDSCIWNLDQ